MNEQKQEQLQKVVQEHPELNDRLKAITAVSQTEVQEKLIELLKEYGVVLTAEDFKATEGELSDDELDVVAGGGICICPLVGGGSGEGLVCACTAGGIGGAHNSIPCYCVLWGNGAS